MPDRSGIGAQLGIVDEVTYGTYVAPTRFLDFNEEGLKLEAGRDESRGLRTGQRVLRSDHYRLGKRSAGGPLEFDIANKGLGSLLTKHLLGTVATTADGAGFRHRGTVGDLFGDMFTVQIGRPDVAGTVQPFSYLGCKIAEWEIGSDIDGFAALKATIDAQDEVTSQALVVATAPSVTEILHWAGCTVLVGGAQLDADKVMFRGSNGLKTDRYLHRGTTNSRLKKEPIEASLRDIGGTLEGEFENLTAYNRFVNGTHATLVATWEASATYDTAKPFKLVVTCAAVRFDGETPNVSGQDVIAQSLPFKVLDDGTSPFFSVDYFTNDAAP